MMRVQLISCSSGMTTTFTNVKRFSTTKDNKQYQITFGSGDTLYYATEDYQLVYCGQDDVITDNRATVTEQFLGPREQAEDKDAWDDFAKACGEIEEA